MASKGQQSKLTSFFVQTKGEQHEHPKLSKTEQLKEILSKMQKDKSNNNKSATKSSTNPPHYATIFNQAHNQRKNRLAQQKKKEIGIEILKDCRQNHFHGPTHGDHSEGKKTWSGYYEHRAEKMQKQFREAPKSIYGNLTSTGIYFDKNRKRKKKINQNDDDMKTTNKKRKLNDDADKNECVSRIFDGVTVYFQGRTADLSSYHLNKVVLLNGGNFAVHPNARVTHIITTNLARSKMNRAIAKMGKMNVHRVYYVNSKWITDSVRNGKLMKEDEYLVFSTNKYGANIDKYFDKQ